MTDEIALHERIAVLETEVQALRQAEADRKDRDRWIIGTLVALAAIIISVVLPFIVSKGGP